jgi:hypothetical protein
MASPDRFQLDDHFAAAKARSRAPAPAASHGTGSVLAVLIVVAAAAGAAWWWAMQPATLAGARPDAEPTTVAERQAAVADQVDGRGPRVGGESHEEYEARLARIRASAGATQDAPAAEVAAPGSGTPDRAPTGRPAAAAGLPAAIAARPPAAPAAPAALAAPDRSALGLADRVNDRREERAAHLRWLDACAKQHLVDVARAQLARAKDQTTANAARIAAANLAADIDTHQREARRIDNLLTTAEQRLVDYCTSHGQQVPPLANPSETVSGIAAQPRPMPAASWPAPTIRPAGGAARPQDLDPFANRSR